LLTPVAMLPLLFVLNAYGTLLPRIGNELFMILKSMCWTELVLMEKTVAPSFRVAWGPDAGL
jgi:hypothetical protein